MMTSITWGNWDNSCTENDTFGGNITCLNDPIHNRRKQTRQLSRKSTNKYNAVYTESMVILQNAFIRPKYTESHLYPQLTVPWANVPFALTPPGGKLPIGRWARKTVQVEAMMIHVMSLINQLVVYNASHEITTKLTVVEFCAGSGFVALPLAYLYPDVDFVLVDRKLQSMTIARERLSQCPSVHNVTLFEGNVEDYNPVFHIGIALHACGSASDFSIERCLACKAAFVVCPCCIGKILHYRNKPLSQTVADKLTELQFKHLVKAADFGHSDTCDDIPSTTATTATIHGNNTINSSGDLHNNTEHTACDSSNTSELSARNAERRMCKSLVEEDRRLHAVEHGYHSVLYTMPNNSSPKNDIIVGWPFVQ